MTKALARRDIPPNLAERRGPRLKLCGLPPFIFVLPDPLVPHPKSYATHERTRTHQKAPVVDPVILNVSFSSSFHPTGAGTARFPPHPRFAEAHPSPLEPAIRVSLSRRVRRTGRSVRHRTPAHRHVAARIHHPTTEKRPPHSSHRTGKLFLSPPATDTAGPKLTHPRTHKRIPSRISSPPHYR